MVKTRIVSPKFFLLSLITLFYLIYSCNYINNTNTDNLENKNISEHSAPPYLKVLKEGMGIFISFSPFSLSKMNCSFDDENFFCSKHISHNGTLISSGFFVWWLYRRPLHKATGTTTCLLLQGRQSISSVGLYFLLRISSFWYCGGGTFYFNRRSSLFSKFKKYQT